MGDIFGPITYFDILYAAVAAFGITFLLTRFNSSAKKTGTSPQTQPPVGQMPQQLRGLDGEAFIAQCRQLFPVHTVQFGGRAFESGDMVRIVTMQQRIIEGELIGQNEQRVICIRTKQNVIAQKLERVMDMQALEEIKQ